MKTTVSNSLLQLQQCELQTASLQSMPHHLAPLYKIQKPTTRWDGIKLVLVPNYYRCEFSDLSHSQNMKAGKRQCWPLTSLGQFCETTAYCKRKQPFARFVSSYLSLKLLSVCVKTFHWNFRNTLISNVKPQNSSYCCSKCFQIESWSEGGWIYSY